MRYSNAFTLCCVPLFAGVVSAQEGNRMVNIYNSAVKDLRPEDRALTEADMGLLVDYGCWCYFEQTAGRGQPIDELDTYCKQLQDGYKCIIDDTTNAGAPCVPWTQSYSSAFGSGFPSGITSDNMISLCDTLNAAGSCAAMTCKVEGWFVQQFFLFATSGGVINAANRHANGFDPNVSCPTTGFTQSDKACCGAFPSRYPFKTYSGARACCGSNTYNTSMFQCCPDMSINVVCN